MLAQELMVRSSIQLMLADPTTLKPVSWGTGCILYYKKRTFLVSVSHVTDFGGLSVFIETGLPSDERGTPIQPIGGFCTFDLFKVTDTTNIVEFVDLLKSPTRMDISFAEIKHEIPLRQEEVDFGTFKVEAGGKAILHLEDGINPLKEEEFGFFGRIRHDYVDNTPVLKMENTLKRRLKFAHSNRFFHRFIVPEIITDTANYEGCSGAPILDTHGRIVALACSVYSPSKVVTGFSILECKKLLDMALSIRML